MVENPPLMQETQVWSLGWEDPLEKGMATPLRYSTWRTPRAEELGKLQSMVSRRVRHDWQTDTSYFCQETWHHTLPPDSTLESITSEYSGNKLFCFYIFEMLEENMWRCRGKWRQFPRPLNILWRWNSSLTLYFPLVLDIISSFYLLTTYYLRCFSLCNQ